MSPAEALLEEIARTRALIAWCELEMSALGGLAVASAPMPGDPGSWSPRMHQLAHNKLQLLTLKKWWDQARQHLGMIAKSAEAGQLMKRQIELNEATARLIARVINRAMLDDNLALTKAQRAVLGPAMRLAIEAEEREPGSMPWAHN
jgi:hypothetical protein